ncbi:MAG: hypothetical protein JWQ25_1866 [Daejeonella sp.]|nr:hypothetical protein [Daejeonella sp.]
MSLNLTTEEKISLFRITLKGFDDYDPHLKHLLKVIRSFYLAILVNQTECENIYLCISQMDAIIDDLELKIKKQRNFQEIMNQIDIHK